VTVDDLIRALLATGEMTEDTTDSLNRIAADSAAGHLDPDDAAYVEALHARLMGAAATSADAAPQLTLEDWRARALKAEAELARLTASPSA
jgi:hypothetical protein